MPERFSTHRRERSEMSGAAEVEEVGCEDFVSFLTSGLEQMIASIEVRGGVGWEEGGRGEGR
jgi:hypothetical protein